MFAEETPVADRKRPAVAWYYWVALVGVIALALLSRAMGWLPTQTAARDHPAVGRELTSLELEPLVGTTQGVQLEQLRGKVSLINFWGPWCTYCREEFPGLMELKDRFSDKHEFRFISVSCAANVGGDKDLLRLSTEGYLSAGEYRLAVYSDPLARTRVMLQNEYLEEAFGYPTTLLLDKKGKIRGIWQGYGKDNHAEMAARVSELLVGS